VNDQIYLLQVIYKTDFTLVATKTAQGIVFVAVYIYIYICVCVCEETLPHRGDGKTVSGKVYVVVRLVHLFTYSCTSWHIHLNGELSQIWGPIDRNGFKKKKKKKKKFFVCVCSVSRPVC